LIKSFPIFPTVIFSVISLIGMNLPKTPSRVQPILFWFWFLFNLFINSQYYYMRKQKISLSSLRHTIFGCINYPPTSTALAKIIQESKHHSKIPASLFLKEDLLAIYPTFSTKDLIRPLFSFLLNMASILHHKTPFFPIRPLELFR